MLLHHTGLKLQKKMKIDVKSHQDTYLKNPLRNIRLTLTHFKGLQGLYMHCCCARERREQPRRLKPVLPGNLLRLGLAPACRRLASILGLDKLITGGTSLHDKTLCWV